MRFVMTVLVAMLPALALPSVALAGGGNAVVEEYVLDIPSGGGSEPGGVPGDTDGGSTLSPGAEAALQAEGSDGAAAADLARATGPDRKGDGGGRPRPDGAADEAGGSGIADVIGDIASGSDAGMGPVLPIVLGLALIGAVGVAIVRRGGQGST